MPRIARIALVMLLCLPNVVAGYLFALFVRAAWGESLTISDGVAIVRLDKSSWPVRTWWKHWSGFSMGYGVMLSPTAGEMTLMHELEHTTQARAGSIAAIPAAVALCFSAHWSIGLLFVLLQPLLNYSGASLVAWIFGGAPYLDNHFERAARDAVEMHEVREQWARKAS